MGVIKKNDLILVLSVLLLAAAAFAGFKAYQDLSTKEGGGIAVVRIDGKKVKAFPLSKDTTYKIEVHGGYNILEIKEGRVRIKEASCPDKICVKEGFKDKNLQSITCLPNKVTVTIENAEGADVDTVAR